MTNPNSSSYDVKHETGSVMFSPVTNGANSIVNNISYMC